MNRKSKYQRRHQKSRDCRDCKKFGGFISKHYFVCVAEMFEDQEKPACHDIYDTDVLTKGTCTLFVPKQIESYQDIYGGKNDDLHVDDALDGSVEEAHKTLSYE